MQHWMADMFTVRFTFLRNCIDKKTPWGFIHFNLSTVSAFDISSDSSLQHQQKPSVSVIENWKPWFILAKLLKWLICNLKIGLCLSVFFRKYFTLISTHLRSRLSLLDLPVWTTKMTSPNVSLRRCDMWRSNTKSVNKVCLTPRGALIKSFSFRQDL